MRGNIIATGRLMQICLGTRAKADKPVLACSSVPFLLFFYVSLVFPNPLLKRCILVLERESAALCLKQISLKIEY